MKYSWEIYKEIWKLNKKLKSNKNYWLNIQNIVYLKYKKQIVLKNKKEEGYGTEKSISYVGGRSYGNEHRLYRLLSGGQLGARNTNILLETNIKKQMKYRILGNRIGE